MNCDVAPAFCKPHLYPLTTFIESLVKCKYQIISNNNINSDQVKSETFSLFSTLQTFEPDLKFHRLAKLKL